MNDPYDQCECPLCHNTGFVSSEDYDEYTAVEAENERLKNENIVRITALNNLHHNLRELQRRNAKLEKNEKVYRGIISRLALNPDNAFALRAEVAALAELEAPDDPR